MSGTATPSRGTSKRGPCQPSPQTNGKVERFHWTLADGWAFKRLYNSENARRKAMPAWIYEINHQRHHIAIGKAKGSFSGEKRAFADTVNRGH